MKWNWNAASAAHLIDTTVAIWKYCFERQTNAPRRRASGAWLHIGTAEMSPTKWLVDKRQTAAFPQQVRFVKQSIKLRQARQNQPAVKKESPTNRKQVESAIFVMCCNCKIFGCFYTVRLRFHLGLTFFFFTLTLHCVGQTSTLRDCSSCVFAANALEVDKDNKEREWKSRIKFSRLGATENLWSCRPKQGKPFKEMN